MRVIDSDGDLDRYFPVAQAESLASSASDKLLIEQYLRGARHIEVQILGDGQGMALHLGERNCSLQRRYQKLLEEAPSPGINDDVRRRICAAAVAGARALNYEGAGTFEFLLDKDDQEYFIEVNGRLQVEHPVTEMITGIDLVEQQLLIAGGEGLSLRQEDIEITGHAMECRINAEDPDRGFAPDAGSLRMFSPPGGFGIRVDSHAYSGCTIPSYYDSLVAKVIAHGRHRDECIRRMARALDDCWIEGVKTNVHFFQGILASPEFIRGDVGTDFLSTERGRHRDAG